MLFRPELLARRIGIGLFSGAFFLYALSGSPYPVPGESAWLITNHSGLNGFTAASLKTTICRTNVENRRILQLLALATGLLSVRHSQPVGLSFPRVKTRVFRQVLAAIRPLNNE